MNPIVSFLRWKQTSDYKKRCAENPYDYHTAMWADIPYICDGSPDHTLDVYAPDDTRTPRPVIFEVHGGGYLACFKEVNRQHGQYLAAGGFNVVNINYSLCPGAGLGTIVNEIAAAMDWAHAHAEEYGFDLPDDPSDFETITEGLEEAAMEGGFESVGPAYEERFGELSSLQEELFGGAIVAPAEEASEMPYWMQAGSVLDDDFDDKSYTGFGAFIENEPVD